MTDGSLGNCLANMFHSVVWYFVACASFCQSVSRMLRNCFHRERNWVDSKTNLWRYFFFFFWQVGEKFFDFSQVTTCTVHLVNHQINKQFFNVQFKMTGVSQVFCFEVLVSSADRNKPVMRAKNTSYNFKFLFFYKLWSNRGWWEVWFIKERRKVRGQKICQRF